MSGKVKADSLFWVEEFNGQACPPKRMKRKVRSKKREYIGWGSTQLISFLESIDKDSSIQLSQRDVTTVIDKYVQQNSLLNPDRKKRVICDERLHSLFGRKSISRLKIYDLLESHFAANCEESSDDSLFNSEDDENILATSEYQKTTTLERQNQSKNKVTKKPKSCFAAIIPANIKLVYLKRSLVEELLKDPETFESKVVGSFIRIRCDPNDYLQKNSHQLLQVTGIKNFSGMKDMSGDILLQVSGYFKDISIHKLSDDNFSEEECEDLCQRVKDGLLKRPMIVDLEQKATVLHKDMTKHEIPSVISDDVETESTEPDVPDTNVENKSPELMQTTHKQASLLTEVQKEVRNGFKAKTTTLDISDCVKHEIISPKSILTGNSEVPLGDLTTNGTASSSDTVSAENHNDIPVQQQPVQQLNLTHQNVVLEQDGLNEAKVSQETPKKQELPPQVIEISDDEETEEPNIAVQQIQTRMLDRLIWHYKDPYGFVQGPFSINNLKHWSDSNYFPPDFKVWKTISVANGRNAICDGKVPFANEANFRQQKK
ncbi:Plus-3 domain, subgroup protein [Senna tora]|uniref:Plus-3 domain, subgroup protein n=1 Tax=Senna tora TaxID=362788 RepID=A0A834T155_9FABA|nr:Plus-3 domain, subgroup protein [Senna tora]